MPEPVSVLDRDFALERCGGDLELLKEIAELFIDDYPRLLDDMQRAIGKGDTGALERTARELKRSVANYGAVVAVAAAQDLEEMGSQARLLNSVTKLSDLETALAQLRIELRAL